MKPDKKDIQKWVTALRSGEYKQTRYELENKNGMCCLGVACKLFIKKEHQNTQNNGQLFGILPDDQNFSPKWLDNINYDFKMETNTNLSDLNDHDEFSFDEIADCLEAVYILEVLND